MIRNKLERGGFGQLEVSRSLPERITICGCLLPGMSCVFRCLCKTAEVDEWLFTPSSAQLVKSRRSSRTTAGDHVLLFLKMSLLNLSTVISVRCSSAIASLVTMNQLESTTSGKRLCSVHPCWSHWPTSSRLLSFFLVLLEGQVRSLTLLPSFNTSWPSLPPPEYQDGCTENSWEWIWNHLLQTVHLCSCTLITGRTDYLGGGLWFFFPLFTCLSPSMLFR